MTTENNITTITRQQTITSMEIAEITGKNHYDVMKAIRKMEPAWEKVRQGKFSLTQRITKLPTGGERKDPMYILTKTECLFVATKFNDEARAKLVLRWEKLEKERMTQSVERPASNLPADPSQLTRKQLLLMALEAEEERERLRAEKEELEADNYGLMLENGQQADEIIRLEERTAYLNVIMADKSTVTITQIAQDYGESAVSFNKLLNGLRIQRKVGEQWVLYADYLHCGYVATRMIPIHHAGAPDTHRPMTVWTQAGRKFIYDRLKKHGILPLIERQPDIKDASLS